MLWVQDGGMLLRLFNHINCYSETFTNFSMRRLDNSVPKPKCVNHYLLGKLALNVEVTYKKGSGYTFMENTEQDG